MDDVIYEPISLGSTCEVKYQLSRALFSRKFPGGDDFDLRRMLLTPEYGQRNFERHVFDWQITPFPAVLEYLESDFQGVYEREDLIVQDGEVVHRRLQTRHPHEFHALNGALDDAAIDAQYEAARGKFEHLAAKFRRHLQQPGNFLYVIREIRIYGEALRALERLRAGAPDHVCKLLFVGYDGDDQHLGGLAGEAFKAWATLETDKEPSRQWEGNDAAWDAVLDPWKLTIHGGDRIARTFDEGMQVEG